jgi:hypothetical protein
MGQRKGQTGNPNGRTKGTPNRITGTLREKIQQIVESNIDLIQSDIDSLEAKDRLQIIEKLMSYCIPKLTAQSVDIDFNQLSDIQLNSIINSINLQDGSNDTNEPDTDTN